MKWDKGTAVISIFLARLNQVKLSCRGVKKNETPVDINVDKSTQKLEYFHRFRIFKYHDIWQKNVFKIFVKVKSILAPTGLELIQICGEHPNPRRYAAW